MIKASIQQCAAEIGIATGYYDIDGGYHHTADDVLSYFHHLLSHHEPPLTHESIFAALKVIAADKQVSLRLSELSLEITTGGHYKVINEQSQLVTEGRLSAGQTAIDLPALSSGYYTLSLDDNRCYRLIAAPATCYQPDTNKKRQLRGLNLQLYSLRSDNNWGIGDFGDMYDAIDEAGQYGFDFIGLNPLHALFPAQPELTSPYSPSSRYWHNWIYLCMDWIPEFTQSKAAGQWLAGQQAELQALRNADQADYAAVTRLKMQALTLAFSEFELQGKKTLNKRYQAFIQFVQAGGEALRLNSAFHVLNQKMLNQASGVVNSYKANKPLDINKCGWLSWLKPWQDVNHPYVQKIIADNAGDIRFYSYLQWLVDEQLHYLSRHCKNKGLQLGMYGDLAVGSARGGADIWINPRLYWINESIGAPPDPLGPVGQDWQLPPMNPNVLLQQGLQPFIDLLRANMRYYGALRIDHVMGLYRLWLIPAGKTAADGAYVHYPFELLMAILAVESQRAGCVVIGEDLGTVPDEVRHMLDRYQVLSYRVFYFAERQQLDGVVYWDGQQTDTTQVLSVIGTHDLPPLTGWWHCCDLALLGKLGILSSQALQEKYQARLDDKQAILNTLKAEDFLPPDYEINALTMAMHDKLNYAIHAYCAAQGSRLFAYQPENFCRMTQAFNIPGTFDEVANWQSKLPAPLSKILQQAAENRLLNKTRSK